MRLIANVAILVSLSLTAAHAQELAENRWQYFPGDGAGGLAAVAKGNAQLTLHNGCDGLAIHYQIPSGDLDPAFAGISSADLVFTRDGGKTGYGEAGFIDHEGFAVFILFIEPDSGFVGQLTSANRTITVGVSLDAENGRKPKNQTNFSATGSTAAVKQVLAACDGGEPAAAFEPSSAGSWTVEPFANGLPGLESKKGEAIFGLACRRDQSGNYQISYVFPADQLDPELIGLKSMYLRLGSTNGELFALDAGAPDSYDGLIGFSHNITPTDAAAAMFANASGAISVGVSATEDSEPFNTVVFTAKGLEGTLPKFQEECAAAAN